MNYDAWKTRPPEDEPGYRECESCMTGDEHLLHQDLDAAHKELARVETLNAELLEALRGLVEGIERAAAAGVDLTGHIGVGDALAAIAKAETA